MSLRDELAQDRPAKPCCRNALLMGLTAALPAEGGRFTTTSAAVAELQGDYARPSGHTATTATAASTDLPGNPA